MGTTSGYTIDELVGRPIFDLYADTANGKLKVREVLQRVKAGKEVHEAELVMRRADGRKVYLNLSVRPSIDINGRFVASRFTAIDVTKRKQAEEALLESEQKYWFLFENMLDGFAYCKILVDENNQPIDFVFLEVNDAFERLAGLKRESVIGRKVTQAIPGIKESHHELFSICGKVALTGGRLNLIYISSL